MKQLRLNFEDPLTRADEVLDFLVRQGREKVEYCFETDDGDDYDPSFIIESLDVKKKKSSRKSGRYGKIAGHIYEKFCVFCFDSQKNLSAWLQTTDSRAKTDYIIKNNITEQCLFVSQKSYRKNCNSQVLQVGKNSRFSFFGDHANVVEYIQDKGHDFNPNKSEIESTVKDNIIHLLCECFEGPKDHKLNATHLCLLAKDDDLSDTEMDKFSCGRLSDQEEIDIFNSSINTTIKDMKIFNIADIILRISLDESLYVTTRRTNGDDLKNSLGICTKINGKECKLLTIKTHGTNTPNPQVVCNWSCLIKFMGEKSNELSNIIQ